MTPSSGVWPADAIASLRDDTLANGPDASLQTALLLERKCFQLLFASEDRDEGIAAMLEKRDPQFKGK